MAWLASWGDRPVGAFGDLAIFCLYKTFGLPDGGCVVSRTPPDAPRARRDLALLQTAIHHGAWLAQRYGAVGRLRALARARGPSVSRLGPRGGRFALGDPDSRPSMLTTWLLPRVADAGAAARRRDNLRALRRSLGEGWEVVARPGAEGAAPVGLPLRVPPELHERVLDALRRVGAAASRFWTEPHPALDAGRFPGARALRAECLVLPGHQELRTADLDAMAAALQRVAPSVVG